MVTPNFHAAVASPPADETRERRIEGPPLPSSPHGEATDRLASLDYHPSLRTDDFTLSTSRYLRIRQSFCRLGVPFAAARLRPMKTADPVQGGIPGIPGLHTCSQAPPELLLSGELKWPRDNCAAIANRKSPNRTRPRLPRRLRLLAARRGSRPFLRPSRSSLEQLRPCADCTESATDTTP